MTKRVITRDTLFQYLSRSQLTKTESTFVSECAQLSIPIQSRHRSGSGPGKEEDEVIKEEVIQHALEMFDEAYEDAFFKVIRLQESYSFIVKDDDVYDDDVYTT